MGQNCLLYPGAHHNRVKDFVLLNNNFSSFFYLCNPLNPADVKDERLEVQHDREVP